MLIFVAGFFVGVAFTLIIVLSTLRGRANGPTGGQKILAFRADVSPKKRQPFTIYSLFYTIAPTCKPCLAL